VGPPLRHHPDYLLRLPPAAWRRRDTRTKEPSPADVQWHFAENGMSEHKQLISIWFFIGALLAVYGVLIASSELYHLGTPYDHEVVLSDLHAGLWWGVLMLVLGVFYCLKFRPGKQ
jgi:hypothetical protein